MSAGQVECPEHGFTLRSDGASLACRVKGCRLYRPLVSSWCALGLCGQDGCTEEGCECECHDGRQELQDRGEVSQRSNE
jgi:hypothetical protein